MARIKKYSPEQKLSSFQTLIVDDNPNSDYFRITEFKDTFTGGKNGFLIEGSEYLKETTEIKIEILDVDGNPIFYEPAKGVPEYYEGISSLIAVYIYNDTPIGLGKITILGELKQYDDNGVKRDVPSDWTGTYNVKWERTFQINKILSNEDRVRFFKRPQINIDEINKPIFNNNANLVTQIGNVNGIPLAPTAGTSLSEFSLPTSYRLNVSSGNNWTGSIDGSSISFDNINYNPIVLDVVSETEVIVSPPYAPNGIVSSFSNESYTTSFNYLEGVSDLATALTGSFAKISITDMKTVVGDAARVKVYRRSQSNLTDFEFVQEIQLESNELLRDIETTEANEISYGTFTQDVISQYWMTSSNDISVELNTGFLYNSAKLNSTEGNHFLTTQSFSIQSGVEYTLDFNVKKGSVSPTNFLKATLSGSLNGTPKSQTIVNIPSSNAILQKQNFTENIIADDFDEARLYFEVDGTDWYINNVSLKASQETSFSPDEITFIQQVPKTLQTETFDYRFEFYDINNNYIPILVEDTKTFDGGNLNLFNKDITITPNNLYFSFDSASAPSNPLPPTTITFDVETTLVTGSITYTSGAYDEFGDLILSSEYVGGQYPGVLSGYETLTPTLTVADFTGSRDDITVQYIRFTGEVEDVSDSVVITRTQDGKGGVNFEIRPYRGTIIKNKDEKTLEVQAIRIDGVNEIILRENLPQNGFSDAKLRVQSGSEYILLSEADSTGYILGLSAGTTGSGELDYNAVFDRTSITGQLPLYLMDGDTEEDILTTLLLTDLQDGLGAGFVTFDVEQFNINPKEDITFTPQTASLAGNFYLRGTNASPISGTLKVFPSMSITDALLPEYYMFFETGAFDSRITVTATNAQNEIIDSGIPGDSVGYYSPIDSKQLTFNFTYTEDFTSESISVDKTIFVAPDGIGIEPVVISLDPLTVNLNSNQQGEVYSYAPLDTTITAKQGKFDLIYTGSGQPGTFFVELVTPTNITYTSESFTNTSANFDSWSYMDSGSLLASVDYDLKVYPYYTSSFELKTITQRITKGVDGSDAIEIEVNPSVVSLQANENGTVSDYTSANTDIVVKQGNLYLSYETSSLPGTYNVSATGSGIVVGSVSASSQYDLDFGDETVHYTNFSGLESQSGSVNYNFYVYPYSLTNGVFGVEETYSKKQLFSKSNDGTAARNVSLSTTTDVVNFDGDGVITSPLGSIFLTATPFNTTGSVFYQFFRDGFAYSLVSSDTSFEIGSGDATSPGETATWQVKMRDGGSTADVVATAEVTIVGIKAGADNYQVFLTNPSPSVGVEVDGTTTLDTTGTGITALKGTTELTHVSTYSPETVNLIGDPIGTLGEFSASIHSIPPYITQPNLVGGNPAIVGPITDWTLPQDNNTATIVYKVDIENGRATYFLSQSISTVFEGATGPGIVVRGEWTGSIDFLFSLEQQRRDAVIYRYDNSGEEETHFFATTNALNDNKRLPYTASSGFTDEPFYDGTQEQGDVDSFGWEYLGQQDMFVAAKIAIFEESFVENTINVGIPPAGNPNANIAIVGGTDEPYIAVGQTGTQGFAQSGVFIGITNDGGPNGTSGTMGLLSLKGVPDGGGSYNSMEWDGDTLTIRGAIRQTAAGQIEPSLRGDWVSGEDYYIRDSVIYNGQSWSCNTNHTSTAAGTDGPPGAGDNWDSSSGTGKTVSLSADTFVIEYDQDGNNPSPSSINLFASSSNFIDPYFKFTGGGSVFTDETTFTDGNDTNNDSATSIDLSGTTISDLPLQFRVGTADGGLSGQDQTELVSDVINLFGIKPGSDTTPQYMITPTSGGTQIKNNSGNIVLQVQESSVSGLSDISSGNIKLYKDDSSLLNASMSGITGDEYNPTIGPDAINGTLILELRDSSDDSVLDTIALLDVTDGLGGGSFISSNLKSTRTTSTNTFPITNTFTPELLSTTASFYDTSGTEYTQSVIITPSFSGGVDRMAVSAGIGDTTNITITAGDGDGGTITLGGSDVPTKDVVLTSVFTDPATGQTTTINETFYIISDGADGLDAITVINTNQSHTLAADSDGTVSSFVGSGTTISVFEGTTKLDYSGSGDSAGHFTISTNPTNINVGTISDSGDDALVGDHSTITDTSASIVYSISGQRLNGTVFTAETTQTLTKAIAGTSAKQLSITSDSQIYSFDDVSDTTPDENDITFTISQQNLSTSVGTSDITITPATTAAFNPSSLSGTITNGSGQQTFVLSFSGDLSSGKADLPVTISVTNDGITDTTTIYKIEGGSDSDPQYFITPTNGTQIKNGSGTLALQAQSSDPANGLQSLSSGDIKIYSGSNLITTYAGVTGTDYGPIITADAIFGTMNLTLSGSDGVLDSLTLLDVTDGLGGGSFISPNLKSNRSTFDNSFTPTLLRATASFYDTSGTEYQGRVEITPSFSGGVDRMAVSTKVGDSEVVITAGDGDGGTITLGGASVPTKDTVLTAVFTDPATGQTTTINETFYIVSDGVDGIDALTIILTNESHTLPASSDGTVTSFDGSGTDIYLYEGTASILYDGEGTSNGTFDISTTPTNITVGSISDEGIFARVENHSNMTEDSASIVYTLTGKRINGDDISVTKTQSFVKARAGVSGSDGTTGASGAGITYRGEWANDAGVTYNSSDARKDVVKFNGDFYIADYDGGDTFAGNITPPNATYWATFGAQFESVATDILFAEDVYANRTINIGTGESGNPVIALNADSSSGYANPFISIGQTTQGFESDGIFMGFDEGTASLSLTGENVKTNIGGWEVDKSGLFYETQYSVGDAITAEFYATSSLSPSSILQWLYYSGIYMVVYNYRFGSGTNGALTNADAVKIYTRTPDPFGSGSQMTVYGQITTTHTINGYDDTGDLGVFTLEGPALYAESSSIDLLTYVTSSFDLSAGGKGSTKAEIVWEAGTNYIQAFETGTGLTVPLSWNTVSNTGSFTDDNWFGAPDHALHSNAYVYATNVDVGSYVSESVAIKLVSPEVLDSGTDSKLQTEIYNDGPTWVLSDDGQNPATNQFILYTIHRTGETIDTFGMGTVKAGGLGEAVITGDAIRLSTSGSDTGTDKPFISLGQSTAGYDNRGVFIGFPSASTFPHLSMRSPSGDFMRYNGDSIQFSGDLSGGTIEGTDISGGTLSVGLVSGSLNQYNFTVDNQGNVSASNAELSGIVNATSGRIGDWIIDVDTKALRDEDGEIVFEPNIPELQFYTGSEKKVIIGPQPILSDIGAASGIEMTFTSLASAQPDDVISVTSTAPYGPSYTGYSVGDKTSGPSGGTIDVAVGDIQIGLTTPTMTLNPPTQFISQTTSYPNYSPSFTGQTHGSVFGPIPIIQRAELFLEVVDTTNSDAVIGRKLIAQTTEARSAHAGLGNYYTGTYTGNGGGGELTSEIYSVVGNTEITLADGSTILAKDIKIGQKILAWNWNTKIDTHNGIDGFDEFTIDDVKRRTTNEIYKITVGDNVVEVSDSHGFWKDNNEQIKATEIIAGESKIYVKDGNSISLQLVDDVEIIGGDTVYTFSVPGVYNYISNNIISHNISNGYWTYTGTSQGGVAAVNGSYTGVSQTVSIPVTTASTAAALRYSVRLSTIAGSTENTNSSGTTSFNFISSTVAYNNTSTSATVTTGYLQPMTLDTTLDQAISSNFVELKAGGLQVVSSENSYVRIKRREPGDANPELFKLTGGTAYFDVTNGGTGISAIVSTGNIIPGVNDLYDLGNSSFRWDDVFATNGTINTSDENQKENITTSDLGLDFINALNPVSYKFISGSRTHYGLGAQSVETTLESFEKDSIDFAGLITGSSYGLRYHEFISPMIKAIQELTDKVTQLEAQISGSIS